MKRRSFLKKTSLGAGLLTAGSFPLAAFDKPEVIKLTILHTNDVHSRIEAFPMDGGRMQGLGGAAKRATLLEQIRKVEKHTLLLDAGDIFQGTPYFNYFGGELEFKLMSAMKYDVATIGNHDFDAGIDGLAKQLPKAKFSFVNCNYDLSDTILHDKVKPYKIFRKGDLKIGVLGVGIELEGLVPENLYQKTRYLDPIAKANQYAALLKHDEKCDYVICLSHLGYKYKEDKISDIALAKQSEDIDLILGGHTHTFLEQPDQIRNKKDRPVIINQVGWAGIMLGRLDVYFERNFKDKCVTCNNIFIGQSVESNK